MARPWRTLDAVQTPDGELKLLARQADDVMVTHRGRVLMVSRGSRSEEALASSACDALAVRRAPRLLIGGLGLGFTLRAALDACPAAASLTVCELNEAVVEWCRGPVAHLSGDALTDPRVEVQVDDVARVIRSTAEGGPRRKYDAILLDLYEGPNEALRRAGEPYYGLAALAATRAALRQRGVFAVWSEAPDVPFEKRLRSAGFEVERRRPSGGGRRHVVYLARRR
jgi:spermidine synthase